MPHITVEARITGKVQGVAYRAWTQSRARRLALNGYVQNEPFGSVRAVFAGERSAVNQMLDELWEGPGAASVTDVQSAPIEASKTAAEAAPSAAADGFSIRYGAD